MGECWSCGAPVGGLHNVFTCPACEENTLMKDIRKGVRDVVEGQEIAMQMIASGLSNVADKVSGVADELSDLAGIVQGGFDELNWELQQQTQVLLSIDQTLKSPSQTQAREWREMAEQLRKRGCLDEAEQWFLKSLEMSPLDFRTYVGLAMNYLRKNDFDKAEEVLTKSFPHAPKGVQGGDDVMVELIRAGHMIEAIKLRREATNEGLKEARAYVDALAEVIDLEDIEAQEATVQDRKSERQINALRADAIMSGREIQEDPRQTCDFDYKSLSRRLIGRIFACRGDYGRAAAELRSAIDLSPNYPEGNYDYALYCVQSGKTSGWEEPLHRAISARPGYLNVAWVERRFFPARQELKKLLSGLVNEAYRNASQAIHDAETKFTEAQRAVANVPKPDAGRYEPRVKELAALLATAKSDWASKDYVKILKARVVATNVAISFSELAKEARNSLSAFLEEKERRRGEAEKTILGSIILAIVIFVIVGLVSCVVACFFSDKYGGTVAVTGILLGAIVGVIPGIIRYREKLDGK